MLLIQPIQMLVASAVSAANAANVPVITVDRVANSGKVVSHIASNNIEGGSNG